MKKKNTKQSISVDCCPIANAKNDIQVTNNKQPQCQQQQKQQQTYISMKAYKYLFRPIFFPLFIIP